MEVLRRTSGKAVMTLFVNDITHVVVTLRLGAGHDAEVEAIVHAIHDIFSKENTEAVLLIDARNAFNLINRKGILYNSKFLCSLISTYICPCFVTPPRLVFFSWF